MRSCNHTVGTVPKNNHRSASGLESPERVRSDQHRRPAAEVVQQQHEREREPIAHDRENLSTTADARGDEPGGDVEQQKFAIEREPVR